MGKRKRATPATFLVHREVLDENGIYNPVDGEGTVEGAFQVNVHSDQAGYQQLADFFRHLAEVHVRDDPHYHEHHTFTSADGRTRIHLICRKDDERWR